MSWRGDGAVLGADLHADVALGDDVVLDHEVAAAVDVDAGREAAAVARARPLDAVAADDAVPAHLGVVGLDVGLAADAVDADVVDVVHVVVADHEAVDVAVQA